MYYNIPIFFHIINIRKKNIIIIIAYIIITYLIHFSLVSPKKNNFIISIIDSKNEWFIILLK